MTLTPFSTSESAGLEMNTQTHAHEQTLHTHLTVLHNEFPFHTDNTDTDKVYKSQKVLKKDLLPDGEFLSFDSILKSFFSSSVRNVLSPQSGQHPSTVFTRSPRSFLHSFSLFCLFLLRSLSLFFLSFSVDSCCWWRFVARTLVPLSVRPLLAENLHRGHCCCCVCT